MSSSLTLNFRIAILIVFFVAGIEEVTSSKKGCEPWSSSKEKFARISENSKFVYFTPEDPANNNKGTWDEARDICKKNGLEIASLTSQADVQSLESFYKKEGLCQDKGSIGKQLFWLGMTDKDKEGQWIDVTTDKKISFQNFYLYEPMNAPKTEVKDDYGNYAYIKCTGDDTIGMYENDKDGDAGVLCQYEPSDKCFKDSAEATESKEIDDKMDSLGQTEKRSYLISKKQQSQKDALSYCKSKDRKLLDLDPTSGVDDYEIKTLSNFLIDWKTIKGLPLWGHSVWSSGKYKDFKTDEEFTWQSTDNKFSEKETGIKWKFSEDSYLEKHRKSEPFGDADFSCISLAPVVESTPLTFVRSVCTVPHWVVCYNEPESDIVPTEESTDSNDDETTTENAADTTESDDGTTTENTTDSDEDETTTEKSKSETELDVVGGDDPKVLEIWQWGVIAV